jgi:hypothetical protein
VDVDLSAKSNETGEDTDIGRCGGERTIAVEDEIVSNTRVGLQGDKKDK